MNRQAIIVVPKIPIVRLPGPQRALEVSDSADANAILDMSNQAAHPVGCPCCSVSKQKSAPDPSQLAPVPDHAAPVSSVFHAPVAPAAPSLADTHHATAVFAPSPYLAILGGFGEHLNF